MDGSLNTGGFPAGLKTLVGLKDLLDWSCSSKKAEEERRPKTASSVFSSEKFYWQQLGRSCSRRRGERRMQDSFFPAVALQATTAAAVSNDKRRRKKEVDFRHNFLAEKGLLLNFFTLLTSFFQRFFNCNRRWWRRSRRNFKEDILAGDNLILLSSLHSTAFTLCLQRKKMFCVRPLINLSFIFLLLPTKG